MTAMASAFAEIYHCQEAQPAATRKLFMAPEHLAQMLSHAAASFVLNIERRDRISISANAMRTMFDELAEGEVNEVNGVPVMLMPEGFQTQQLGEWVEVVPALEGWMDCITRISADLPCNAMRGLSAALKADDGLSEELVMVAKAEFESHVKHMQSMSFGAINAAVEQTRAEWRKEQIQKEEAEKMNAQVAATESPENYINAAHSLLAKADDAMTAVQVSTALKITRKAATAQLKELNSLGLLENELRKGGTMYHRLLTTAQPGVCDLVQTEGSAQTEASEPEHVLVPGAQAEQDHFVVSLHPDSAAINVFAEKMDSKMAASRAKGRGGWSSTTEVSDERLADDLINHLRKTNAGNFIDLAIYAMMLDHRGASPDVLQKSLTQQQFNDDCLMLGYCSDYKPWEYLNPISVVSVMDQLIEAQHTRLLQLESLVEGLPEGAIDGGWTAAGHSRYAKSLEDSLAVANADLEAARRGYTEAINEANRLRGELATERQAREVLQEQSDALNDAAVGYLVRGAKGGLRFTTKIKNAQAAALSAVRSGATRVAVQPVGAPIGVARRGVEWKGMERQAAGD